MSKIIDIEGLDGCGKQTQTKLLYDFLIGKGYKCLLLSFPNYDSESSAPVKMYLRGDFGKDTNCLDKFQASTLFAVDRLLTTKKIDFNNYDFVLMDRYTPSNMIHQSKNMASQQEMDNFLNWLEDFEYGKLNLPKPDEIIFLDVPSELSIKLARARKEYKTGATSDIHEEDENYLKKCYQNAKYIANKYNWNVVHCDNDGKLRSIEDIHNNIKQILGF